MAEDDDYFDRRLKVLRCSRSIRARFAPAPRAALVHEKIYDRFMEKAVARVEKIKQGNPLDLETMIGAQASSEQLHKILSYIEIGTQEGAKVLTGGERNLLDGDLEHGFYVKPTVFEAHNKMRSSRKKTSVPSSP